MDPTLETGRIRQELVPLLAVTKLGLPGWILPVGLIAVGALLKGSMKSASA